MSAGVEAAHPVHARWVRVTHWVVACSALTSALSGCVILMAHPRLYWGEVGNDLTPALIELPISRNYRHGGWDARAPFFADRASPVTAARTYDIFNENGWGRSLHFLAAWFLVVSAGAYVCAAIVSGHLRRNLLPGGGELTPQQWWRAVTGHAHAATPPGPPYNPVQKLVYLGVVFIALPVLALSGMTMSPAIAAAYPVFLDVFGGSQSARTIHFGMFVLLILFVLVHVSMVITTGFKRQMRAMILGIRT